MAQMFHGSVGAALADIVAEYERSLALHPNYTKDTVRRGAITMEEGLETLVEMVTRLMFLQKTVLGVTRVSSKEFSTNNLKEELIQTAAMCLKHLIALRDEESHETIANVDSGGSGNGHGM